MKEFSEGDAGVGTERKDQDIKNKKELFCNRGKDIATA